MKTILAAAALVMSIAAPALAQSTAPATTGQSGTMNSGGMNMGGETNKPAAAPSTDTTGAIVVDPNATDDGNGQNSSPQSEDSSQGGDRAVGGRAN